MCQQEMSLFFKAVAGVFPSAVHVDVLMLTSTDRVSDL